MPDETTNTDTPVVAEVSVEVAVTESTIVAEPEPVAVVEPVVESASLGTSEEVSATQIDAFPGAPLSENIDSPVVDTVSEPGIVAEQPVVTETTVAIEPALVVDTPVDSTVIESITAVEQPVPTAQEPTAPQSGDLDLTPQMAPFEALKPETPPAIQAEVPPPEPTRVSVFETASPVEPIKTISTFIRKLLPEANFAIQFRKRKKLDRIMGLFAKQASVTNDDTEKLLHISDATASRYLGILEKEGKIKRVGTAGRWVSYAKV